MEPAWLAKRAHTDDISAAASFKTVHNLIVLY
jgi:hypothetical protein